MFSPLVRSNFRKGTNTDSSYSRAGRLFLHAVMLKTARLSVFWDIMHALIFVSHISRNSGKMKKDFLKINTLIISEVP